jgi:hypothetical protein
MDGNSIDDRCNNDALPNDEAAAYREDGEVPSPEGGD